MGKYVRIKCELSQDGSVEENDKKRVFFQNGDRLA